MASGSRDNEKQPGFLPIETNWFDRLFISVVAGALKTLLWMRFIEPFGLSVWFAAAISAVLGAYIIWKG